MILATHAVAGAAAAKIFESNPLAAFIVAFLSHFILDAIPHWDYTLLSYKKSLDPLNGNMVWGKKFIIDLVRIFFDFWTGIFLSILFFKTQSNYQTSIIILGAFGGMLPDALQFAYWKLKTEPLKTLQKFHRFAHTKNEILKEKTTLGILTQLAIIALIILIFGKF